jgi:adenine-specific DNA methylase
MNNRRFIEESFPVKEVGEASAKEKNIRHGHISTLHLWWARRPLAASRATTYAALTPAPTSIEEWQKKRDFIIELSKWENSNNQQLLERARQEILDANGDVPPKVLDPFSGGGSYPLEAMRLGCEAYANDYNPVAVLIEKATLEFPQKFGRPFEGMPEWALPGATEKRFGKGKHLEGNDEETGENTPGQPSLFNPVEPDAETLKKHNPLLEGVRYWGNWVLEESRKELAEFYPHDPDGSIPVGYIWARTIPCQNPACGQDIPLIRQFWLANKINKKNVALYPQVQNNKLSFRIIGNEYQPWPEGFDAGSGTISRAIATCPICGSTVDAETTRQLFGVGKSGHMMLAIVLFNPKRQGKTYRVASEQDEQIFYSSNKALQKKRAELIPDWGYEPVPDEPLVRVPVSFGVINVWVYGMKDWGSLYNVRQRLSLITFANHIRKVYSQLVENNIDKEFAKAIVTYLAMTFDRLAPYNTTFCYWLETLEAIGQTFSQGQAIAMKWDYIETNVTSGSTSSWTSAQDWVNRVIVHCSDIRNPRYSVDNNSATQLQFSDNFFDAVLTDPPYYDNVPYSYLSDFFYVWLKRILGHIYPDLFSTSLTPKQGEIVAYAQNGNDFHSGKLYFEESLKKAFFEIRRVLKPDGITVIVYAHKSISGWETLVNALLDSGLVITGAWPLNTERVTRVRANESASLASSIYIVARKTQRHPTGFYNDIRIDLKSHLDTKLHRLWEEGIGGADFFIAAIGSAIEVFGKYEQVMDYEGNIVRADRLLEEVRTIATDYAVRQILHNGFATEISDLSRFYVLWRWNYGEALVPFDEANKLARSCGLDLSLQFNKKGFIRKEKEFARLLGPQNRKLDDLDDPRDLIDVLHKTLLLWEQSKRVEMVQALTESGHGRSEAFYRVAQAISETLPNESKEKKLLDGFLAGRDRVQQEVEKLGEQGRLWK